MLGIPLDEVVGPCSECIALTLVTAVSTNTNNLREIGIQTGKLIVLLANASRALWPASDESRHWLIGLGNFVPHGVNGLLADNI